MASAELRNRGPAPLEPGLRTPPADQLSPPQSEASEDEGVAVPSRGGKKASPRPHPDDDIPDDYVTRTLQREPALPPIQWKNILSEIQWVSFIILTSTPLLAVYGMCTTPLQLKTAVWAGVYYFFTGLGITAGYHRLWAHRSYVASRPLEYFLALMGSGAVEGSIHWWARGHRAHHRYTDTDLDPYGAHHGLLWSHLGWMIVKPRRKPGVADISDLRRHPVIRFQHRFYLPLIVIMGFLFPTAVAGMLWGDWRGGFFYAAVARLVFVHHSTFCVNSLAHYLGEASFDNKMTPRDHFITALVTVGEGYHNFHHQFPMDYRNAISWYQYDPTKWFIASMKAVGLATHLKTFPDNEVKKGRVAMQLQKLHGEQAKLQWPKSTNDLPVISWDDFQEEAKTRPLIVVAGFIHDVSALDHPGGEALLKSRIGKDATTAFHGGVYDHSNGAANLLSSLRVGVLDGGYQLAVDELAKAEKLQAEAAAILPKSSAPEAQWSAPQPTADYRGVDARALAYMAPGQTYSIAQRGELKENAVAKKSGNKVGRLL
ncbi:putative stearoyl-CoA desaturase [Tilletiopsis washingtonensis]|jgi:stearoyl-CoA desaturase (delta-9 desaturase)|uniref:Putative stearoyl-CoA desaturase n=1 Tax=Tilletiopsis washingtonensis TaxID=58919 RepID=A0A316Z7I6_9BASI|nr:putative stearoyl-CoA desaturase [Tilletiopsis washingtonensis]PWN96938.1 putative stearoyl-CoA desaturase [Tilletiopsis washingtonensis]